MKRPAGPVSTWDTSAERIAAKDWRSRYRLTRTPRGLADQLESPHFFRAGDSVANLAGRQGLVTDARSLYAWIRWIDGQEEEIEQFDPTVQVVQRAGHA